ncbi:SH3 domain-containing protein [Streptomyces sp. NPDC020096]
MRRELKGRQMAVMRMRALAVAGVLAVVGLGLGAVSASAATPADGLGVEGPAAASVPALPQVTVDGLRLRDDSGTSAGILGQLYAGDQVRIVATDQDSTGQQWDQVAVVGDSAGGLPDGTQGWVTEAYLSEPTCATDQQIQCLMYGGHD